VFPVGVYLEVKDSRLNMDTANETLLGQASVPVAPSQPAPAKLRRPGTARPEMNRQERVIFSVYVAMIVMIVAFLAVVGLVAGL
jgi:hypothetical protein